MNPKPLEVKWYKENGMYPERITKDSGGKEYVIGDYSWNTFKNKARLESIEPTMNLAIRSGII